MREDGASIDVRDVTNVYKKVFLALLCVTNNDFII